MRRLLFIAYHFPPSGGAGSQRSIKFAKYLRDFGWLPVVITRPPTSADRWTPKDESFDRELAGRVEIVRVAGVQPAPSTGSRARAERVLRLRRPAASWWVDGVVSAGSAITDIDAIVATGSPFDSFDAAARLARVHGAPWIADLRDPWAFDEMTVYPSGLHRFLESRRMRRMLRSAAAIVMNTPEAIRVLLRSFPELSARPVATIPNGFDASDFAGPPPERHDEVFRIVHTGYLHTELGSATARRRLPLGGSVRGLEIITRSHVFLVDALERVAHATGCPIELHLAGVASTEDRATAAGRSFPVVMPGYVTHDRSVELIRSADVLFLPMHDLPPGRRATIVPGKTYEYLASGRPVLGAVPDGDARDLLAQAEAVDLCRPADLACMTRALRGMVEVWRDRGTPTVDRSAVIAPYDRRALTARLAGLLDRTVG